MTVFRYYHSCHPAPALRRAGIGDGMSGLLSMPSCRANIALTSPHVITVGPRLAEVETGGVGIGRGSCRGQLCNEKIKVSDFPSCGDKPDTYNPTLTFDLASRDTPRIPGDWAPWSNSYRFYYPRSPARAPCGLRYNSRI